MSPISGKSTDSALYKLYGVLYHHGKSIGSGHYTVDVLHSNGDTCIGDSWMRIDDEVVSVVMHDDVFGDHDDARVDERCAYMLLYCHTSRNQA